MMRIISVTGDEPSSTLVFHVSSETATALIELMTLASESQEFWEKRHKLEQRVKKERSSSPAARWAARLS